MKTSKTELYEEDLQIAARYFKVLSHPARLTILKYLSEMKICMSGDISNQLPLSRTTVNQHLKELRDVGLIQGEIDGVKINYCLDKEKITVVKEVLGNFLNDFEFTESSSCKKK